MAREQGKQGAVERGLAFYEKLNYALGAIAIGGALVAPAELAAPLIAFGALQIVEGAAIRWLRTRRAAKRPQPAPA